MSDTTDEGRPLELTTVDEYAIAVATICVLRDDFAIAPDNIVRAACKAAGILDVAKRGGQWEAEFGLQCLAWWRDTCAGMRIVKPAKVE